MKNRVIIESTNALLLSGMDLTLMGVSSTVYKIQSKETVLPVFVTKLVKV